MPEGLHLIEFFEAADASNEALSAYFESRKQTALPGKLTYLINRIGRLAPDPGGMALWTFADYVSAEAFIRAKPSQGPARIVTAGLYRNFGEEIP